MSRQESTSEDWLVRTTKAGRYLLLGMGSVGMFIEGTLVTASLAEGNFPPEHLDGLAGVTLVSAVGIAALSMFEEYVRDHPSSKMDK